MNREGKELPAGGAPGCWGLVCTLCTPKPEPQAASRRCPAQAGAEPLPVASWGQELRLQQPASLGAWGSLHGFL